MLQSAITQPWCVRSTIWTAPLVQGYTYQQTRGPRAARSRISLRCADDSGAAWYMIALDLGEAKARRCVRGDVPSSAASCVRGDLTHASPSRFITGRSTVPASVTQRQAEVSNGQDAGRARAFSSHLAER